MADTHKSGNPELIDQHRKVQNKGDQELAGTDDKAPRLRSRKNRRDADKPAEQDTQNSGSAPGGNTGSPGP